MVKNGAKDRGRKKERERERERKRRMNIKRETECQRVRQREREIYIYIWQRPRKLAPFFCQKKVPEWIFVPEVYFFESFGGLGCFIGGITEFEAEDAVEAKNRNR